MEADGILNSAETSQLFEASLKIYRDLGFTNETESPTGFRIPVSSNLFSTSSSTRWGRRFASADGSTPTRRPSPLCDANRHSQASNSVTTTAKTPTTTLSAAAILESSAIWVHYDAPVARYNAPVARWVPSVDATISDCRD